MKEFIISANYTVDTCKDSLFYAVSKIADARAQENASRAEELTSFMDNHELISVRVNKAKSYSRYDAYPEQVSLELYYLKDGVIEEDNNDFDIDENLVMVVVDLPSPLSDISEVEFSCQYLHGEDAGVCLLTIFSVMEYKWAEAWYRQLLVNLEVFMGETLPDECYVVHK